MADEGTHRTLTLQILRYNPQEPARPPRMQPYQLEEADGIELRGCFVSLLGRRGVNGQWLIQGEDEAGLRAEARA